jgi:hypothetical protein
MIFIYLFQEIIQLFFSDFSQQIPSLIFTPSYPKGSPPLVLKGLDFRQKGGDGGGFAIASLFSCISIK